MRCLRELSIAVVCAPMFRIICFSNPTFYSMTFSVFLVLQKVSSGTEMLRVRVPGAPWKRGRVDAGEVPPEEARRNELSGPKHRLSCDHYFGTNSNSCLFDIAQIIC